MSANGDNHYNDEELDFEQELAEGYADIERRCVTRKRGAHVTEH
jgi:hypothetical protein